MPDNLPTQDTFLVADDVMRICRIAVRKAQDESRRLGVANVFTINGQRFYELPNGDLSRVSPTQTGD